MRKSYRDPKKSYQPFKSFLKDFFKLRGNIKKLPKREKVTEMLPLKCLCIKGLRGVGNKVTFFSILHT